MRTHPRDLEVQRPELVGPFDVIGDVHGCGGELKALLEALGWELTAGSDGLPVDARHPEGRMLAFVGDLVDRGPEIAQVLRLVMTMVQDGRALCVQGNHEAKLARKLRSRKGKASPGIQASLDQIDAVGPAFAHAAAEWMDGLPSHLAVDGGALVIVHAGLREADHGKHGKRVKSFALYGDVTGTKDKYGYPVRRDWAADYAGEAAVVYGHTPLARARWRNNTVCLDTACVFGGALTAMRWPERELMSVPARRVFWKRKAPLANP